MVYLLQPHAEGIFVWDTFTHIHAFISTGVASHIATSLAVGDIVNGNGGSRQHRRRRLPGAPPR